MSLEALGVVAKDINKVIQFYNMFGIEFSAVGSDDHYEGKTSLGLRLMIDSEKLTKELNPGWTQPTGSGVVLCFKQNSSKEVNNLYKKLSESGAEIVREPWDAFWGQRYASVKDPSGNQVDIFAELGR